MSNPHDDPGRRPPPPRQGEPPSSYPGGPPPPYQGDPHAYPGDGQQYQGPPQQPTGPWQGPPPGHGMPQQPPMPEPGYQRPKGLLGNLFDFTFDHMVTPQLIKGAYFFAVLFTSMTAVLWLIVGFWLFQYGWLLTVFIVLFTPPLWILSLIGIRMFLEFLINQFKITEHLKVVRDREGPR